MEQSSIRDRQIVFSRYLQAQPFKIPAFSISLFCIGDRLAWIFYTRSRLNFSALNYHLFQKNCCPSPACALCDASIEDVKHYFLYCPSFAALCEKLFTSAAKLLGNRWHCASDKEKIDWLLNGISTADFQINLGCPVVFLAMKSLLLVVGCVIYIYIYICLFFSFILSLFLVCVFDREVHLYF